MRKYTKLTPEQKNINKLRRRFDLMGNRILKAKPADRPALIKESGERWNAWFQAVDAFYKTEAGSRIYHERAKQRCRNGDGLKVTYDASVYADGFEYLAAKQATSEILIQLAEARRQAARSVSTSTAEGE